uniref:Kelch-like protein 12 n=1 Tax=Phallusia mammillata TaxID=59560 RepID=A0A6F9DF84_9ASCI|nr:kelch-like protein 12 [Phallusia mammillata]
MKEKHQSTCQIGEIDDEILALVLDFIYTKKIWVNQDMLSDLLAVGDYFRMEAFSDEIENSLVGLVTYENCVTMWITGKKFKKEKLMQQSERTICSHVLFVANSNEFCNIDQHYMEDFMKLIKKKVSDDQYMKCALLWIRHDMDKRMEKFEMFYDMIEPKSLSQSTWVHLVNMKELVSQNFAAAKAVIPYMRQFVPNAETEFALSTMYVMCKKGEVYKSDMSALKPKACDNNSIFVPKWSMIRRVKTEGENSLAVCEDLTLIWDQKLCAIGNRSVWFLTDAKWQKAVQLITKHSKAAVAFFGDALYVAGGMDYRPDNNCRLESYKAFFGGTRIGKLSPMKFDRSHFALIPYKGFLFAIGGYRSGFGLEKQGAFPIEVYTIESNTWQTLTVTGPDISIVEMYLVHQNRAYIVHGTYNTIQVSTFDLARRHWIPGMNAETGIVERCASLTLGFPDFVSCAMGPPLR